MERDPYTDQTTAMWTRYQLRPSRAPHCPRVVVGKRCRFFGQVNPCVCQDAWVVSILDHARTWLDSAGRHVLTGEPYGPIDNTIDGFLEATRRDGLQLAVELSNESPWNPGYTTLVIIKAL